jgi:uncharacterized RDD family membrane protein YckC
LQTKLSAGTLLGVRHVSWGTAILTCEKCDAEIPDGASVCPQCENPVNVGQIGPVYVPQSTQSTEVIPAISELSRLPARPGFAGFWLRAIACLIDTILIVTIFVLIASFFPTTSEKLLPPSSASLMDMPRPAPLLIVLLAALGCLYYSVFEASSWQATPGKRILRLYVTDLNGQRISFGRALIRNLARQISGIFFIGYLIAGFTEKKQALHDILASCLVLRRL